MTSRRISARSAQVSGAADDIPATWPAIVIERAGKGSLVDKIVAVLTGMISG